LEYWASTSGDWERRAEHLGRSLGAYTPVPSTPCSTGAFVHSQMGVEWLLGFGEGFPLRCFQRLTLAAWLPGDALPDNR